MDSEQWPVVLWLNQVWRDAVERQISHQERNNVRAAYIHKAEHMDERRLMVQWWVDYLDGCRDGYVVPYHFSGEDSLE